MDFRDVPEDAAFRQEVRDFIQRELPSIPRPPDLEALNLGLDEGPWIKEIHRQLARKGWIAPAWPKEYGGASMTALQQFIFNEELGRARVPLGNFLGLGVAGPAIIAFGTEEQKRQHLSGMLSGEVIWCQGFTEPGAGSDLASLQTRAVKDGDDYVVDGQKIWITGAHLADRMFLLARTGTEAPRHKGISAFLVDMRSPGISVQPIFNLADEHSFNQIFLENVLVPRRDLLGAENQGWQVALAALHFERSNISQAMRLRALVEDFLALVRDQPGSADAGLRHELADRYLETEMARLLGYRTITLQMRGEDNIKEANQCKLYGSELGQRIARTGVRLLGLYGQLALGSKWAHLAGRIGRLYLLSPGATLASGASEIVRNVIAGRGLGLPRGD